MKGFLCMFPGAGWRVELNPSSCPASQYDYDCIVGADGKRNSLPGE